MASCALLRPSALYANRALRELPDQQHGAQDEGDIQHCFKHSAPFLFRVDQQSISRFGLAVLKRLLVHAIR